MYKYIFNSDSASGLSDGSAAASGHTDSDAAFRETLKNMGKVSRKKFAQLARLFSRRKRKNFQHLRGDHRENPSRDNLLLNNEDDYAELENEVSEGEELKEDTWNRHTDDAPSLSASNTNAAHASTIPRLSDKH